MTTRDALRRSLHLPDALPSGWSAASDPCALPGDVLTVLGEADTHGVVPRLVVTRVAVEPDHSLRDIARDFLERDCPDATVVCADEWHHPVWGRGVILQSGRVVGALALAEDRLVFRDGDDVVLVAVTCALGDVLDLEGDLGRIIGGLGARVAA